MSLARQSFLSSAARKYATFTLETGQTFCLQSLSELERAAFEASLFDEQGKVSRPNMLTARSRLVCLTLVDDNHQPLFQPNEIELIRAADGAMVDTIYRAAVKHCNLFAAVSAGDSEKNSPATLTDDSP